MKAVDDSSEMGQTVPSAENAAGRVRHRSQEQFRYWQDVLVVAAVGAASALLTEHAADKMLQRYVEDP